jgi:hypothetical protein
MADVLDAVVAAHMVAALDLPLVGWDVALTPGVQQLLTSARLQAPCDAHLFSHLCALHH